jgi:SAM-dependent methyltransferase
MKPQTSEAELYADYANFKKLDLKSSSDSVKVSIPSVLLDALPKDKDALIIDLGCGPGDLIKALQDLGYKQAMGVDLDLKHVEYAKNAGATNIHCDECANFLSNIPDNSVDLVTAFDLIEHLSKPELLELFRIIRAKLKVDSLLLIRCPNMESPNSGLYAYGDLTHKSFLNRFSLEQLASLAKFSNSVFFESHERQPLSQINGFYDLKQYLRFKIHFALWRFYKEFMLLDRNAICTRNILARFKK